MDASYILKFLSPLSGDVDSTNSVKSLNDERTNFAHYKSCVSSTQVFDCAYSCYILCCTRNGT